MKQRRARREPPQQRAMNMDTDPAYTAVYQGTFGAFSEDAARLLLSPESVRSIGLPAVEPKLIGLPSLAAVRSSLEGGRARWAVIPVRNSIAGEVPGADAILRVDGARVVAEIAMPIVQCLVAPQSVTLHTLRKVVSHPMAIAQCRCFLSSQPWLRVERHDDTSGALEMLMVRPARDAAAIASERAAEVWGGVVLKRAIQDRPDNHTTFVLVDMSDITERRPRQT
jgi:prephenate dehydratase